MSSETLATPDYDIETTRVECQQALKTLFSPDELVWISAMSYVDNGPTWIVTLFCPGERSSWRYLRYRYDIPSGTLHFTGALPASEADLATVRVSGTPLFR